MNLPDQFYIWLKQREAQICHRQLLVISGDEKWTAEVAHEILHNQHQSLPNTLWVGETKTDFESIQVKQYRDKLGHEFDILVLDCFKGFRANAAIALSGTVKGKGLMIMLTPSLSEWPLYHDPERVNRISYGYDSDKQQSVFIQHLCSELLNDDSVALLTPSSFTGEPFSISDTKTSGQFKEQDKAVEAICKVALGHRNRPLVLTADRGRGKSSALGIAAASLMESTPKKIWVTAPHIATTEQVFSHARRILKGHTYHQNTLIYENSSITFKPLDKLTGNQDTADLLLIDEAAAIPVHMLNDLVKQFSRVVLSTTIHGYEGSGRGFEIRFKRRLAELKPEYKTIHLSQPIRWFEDDVLEKFWFRSLLYHSNKHLANGDSSILADTPHSDKTVAYYQVTQDTLIKKPEILDSIFKLLINAHYQTSPDDLQRLLDSPEIKCFILTLGTEVVGVAQIVEEGGQRLDSLAKDIAACSRRVKGHLAAQAISSQYNSPNFCTLKQWRVSRIAITPTKQKQGLGKQLLSYISQVAKSQNIDVMTAAFGGTPGLLQFWYKSKYFLAKLSSKPEVSSGENSCICILPLQSQSQELTEYISDSFYQELVFQLAKDWKLVSPGMLIEILKSHPSKPSVKLEQVDILEQLVSGTRSYSTCKRIVNDFILSRAMDLNKLTMKEQLFLCSSILQNRESMYVAKHYGLSGTKEIEKHLRQVLGKMLTTPSQE